MTDSGPVFNQVNLVVRDMAAMVEFYERLGVEFGPNAPPWDRHHQTVAAGSVAGDFDFDLDSLAFVPQWDAGWPADRTGPVLGFALPSREAVDETYRDLMSAGYAGQQAPFDAFFGARYAIVTDPDGNAVGLMSPRDPARQSPVDPPPE
jgi:uncharacterized glyoxalase superfamily protein PhnB